MPNATMIEQRLRFLEIDQDAIDDLQRVRKILEPELDRMLDAFYARISDEPQLKVLFANDESMARARLAQKNHWLNSLLAGVFTDDHFNRAEMIGRAHARVGLTPEWYIGGYSNMLGQFIQHILSKAAEEGVNASPLIEALCKAVFLDLDIVIHSYLESKDRVILDVLMHATRFIDHLEQTKDKLGLEADKLKKSADTLVQSTNADDVQAGPIEELRDRAKLLDNELKQLDKRIDKLKDDERVYLKRGSEHTGTFSQLVSQVIEK